MRKLKKFPKLQVARVRDIGAQPDRKSIGKWRGRAVVWAQDLEKEAWPKDEPFNDPITGPQTGTLPERRVLWWLLYRAKLRPGVDFCFQTDFLGGREQPGGVVADFVLFEPTGGVLGWEILGEYWHTSYSDRHKSVDKTLRLLGISFRGEPLTQIIGLWESDINESDSKRDRICEMALKGIQP